MTLLVRTARWAAVLLLTLLTVAAGWAGWVRYSIVERDVTFRSGSLRLSGTLLTPRFEREAPGVVLVHGSGQTSRRSMLPYAWILASHGYAALAYDKRGVGQSQGPPDAWDLFSFDDLTADATAAYRLMQSQPGVNPRRVGYLGASQGAWVVSEAATRVDRPAFLILISASVATLAEDRLDGRRAMVRHLGFTDAEVEQAVALLRMEQSVSRTGEGEPALNAAMDAQRGARWFEAVYPTGRAPAADPAWRNWQRTVLDFDPRPRLARLEAPVLWIYGDPRLDRNAPVPLSLARLDALKAAGKPYEIIQIPGVGHTLELDEEGPVATAVKVRLPLVRRIFQWLDGLPALRPDPETPARP